MFQTILSNFQFIIWDHLKHVGEIVSDDRIIKNDIIRITETEIACKIIKTSNVFDISFGDNRNTFVSFAKAYRNDAVDLDKSDDNGVSSFSFKKHAFANTVFTLLF